MAAGAELIAYFPAGHASEDGLAQGVSGALASLSGATSIDVRRFEETAWATTWKEHLAPVTLGEGDRRLAIVLPGREGEAPEGVPSIAIEPGLAFGSGHHATTRMCLEWLLELAARTGSPGEREPTRILDVGCGTGVLSIVAARAFPRARVTGIDIDPEALRVAAENAARAGESGRVEVGDEALADVAGSGRTYDLVLANLRTRILEGLAPDLVRVLAPGARLIVSGIGADDPRPTLARFAGLAARDVRTADGWSGAVLVAVPATESYPA